MESRAKILGHPLHQMLIVFPLGLLVMSFIFDMIHQVRGAPNLAEAAYYMIGAGVVTGVIAAVPGLIDWRAIPADTRAKAIGLVHGGGNVVVLLFFAASWYLRRDVPEVPPTAAVLFSGVGTLLGVMTGWLGGELVDRLGVGVDLGAHVNAPSSLRHKRIPGADTIDDVGQTTFDEKWRPSA